MVNIQSPALPFLIVNGWWIGKLLVVVAGVAGIMVPRWWRRRRDRSAIESELSARETTTGSLVQGHSCLRGMLCGRALTLAAIEGIRQSERSDDLAIELGGERVVMRGAIEVVRGTQAVAGGRRLPHGTPPALAKHAARAPRHYRLFSLGDGDEVIVQGRLTRRASHDPAGYRDSAGEWVLQPYDVHGCIAVMAARPAVCPVPLGPVRAAAYMAVAGLACCLVLWGAGTALVASAAHQARTDKSVPTEELEVAAALPFVRASALDELAKDFADRAPRTDSTMRARFALEELRAGCRAKVALELVEERYDDALAAGCGSVDQRVDALVRLARYDEAAALARGASPELSVLALIGAGQWADAATVVSSHADRRDRDRARDVFAESGTDEHCLAGWMRAKAGAPASTEQLTWAHTTCEILQALLLPPPDRWTALREHVRPDDGSEDALLADSLAWASGAHHFFSRDVGLDEENVALHDGRRRDVRLWLAPLALSAPDPFPDPFDRTVAHAERAGLEMFRGDFSAARNDVAEAVRFSSGAPELGEDLGNLADTIAAHAGTAPTHAPAKPFEDVFNAAAAGDGQPLAHALERGEIEWSEAGRILPLLPRVQQGRAELAEALRWYHATHTGESNAAYRYYSEKLDSPKPAVEELPFRDLVDDVTHRDLARLAGDPDEAKRWQGIIDRQLDVLAVPDKLVAFLIWTRD